MATCRKDALASGDRVDLHHVQSYDWMDAGDKFTTHDFKIKHNGKQVAAFQVHVSADDPHTGMLDIGGSQANALGPGIIRPALRQLSDKLPQIKKLWGSRISGARAFAGKGTSTATVRLRPDNAPVQKTLNIGARQDAAHAVADACNSIIRGGRATPRKDNVISLAAHARARSAGK